MINKKTIAALVALGGFAGGAFASRQMEKVFRAAFSRSSQWSFDKLVGGSISESVPVDKYADNHTDGLEWFNSQKFDETWIESSRDESRLHAEYLHCEEPQRIILCAHGYRGTTAQFAGIARWLNENGCDLLLINQRGTGKSGGEWITFGALEQYDVVDWLKWIHAHNYGNLPVYMYGISLGAASVSCASGHKLPDDVAGVIVDCGFSSLTELITDYVDKTFHISASPFLKYLGDKSSSLAGFDLRTADPSARLLSCRIPALFIHGTADTLVNPKHTVRNYKACASPVKDIVWFEGAEHGVSFLSDPTRYEEALTEFFAKCENLA